MIKISELSEVIQALSGNDILPLVQTTIRDVSVIPGTETRIDLVSHGLPVNSVVRFTTQSTLPSGLIINHDYYVSPKDYGQNSFKIAASEDSNVIVSSVGEDSIVTMTAKITVKVPLVDIQAFLRLDPKLFNIDIVAGQDIDLPHNWNTQEVGCFFYNTQTGVQEDVPYVSTVNLDRVVIRCGSVPTGGKLRAILFNFGGRSETVFTKKFRAIFTMRSDSFTLYKIIQNDFASNPFTTSTVVTQSGESYHLMVFQNTLTNYFEKFIGSPIHNMYGYVLNDTRLQFSPTENKISIPHVSTDPVFSYDKVVIQFEITTT